MSDTGLSTISVEQLSNAVSRIVNAASLGAGMVQPPPPPAQQPLVVPPAVSIPQPQLHAANQLAMATVGTSGMAGGNPQLVLSIDPVTHRPVFTVDRSVQGITVPFSRLVGGEKALTVQQPLQAMATGGTVVTTPRHILPAGSTVATTPRSVIPVGGTIVTTPRQIIPASTVTPTLMASTPFTLRKTVTPDGVTIQTIQLPYPSQTHATAQILSGLAAPAVTSHTTHAIQGIALPTKPPTIVPMTTGTSMVPIGSVQQVAPTTTVAIVNKPVMSLYASQTASMATGSQVTQSQGNANIQTLGYTTAMSTAPKPTNTTLLLSQPQTPFSNPGMVPNTSAQPVITTQTQSSSFMAMQQSQPISHIPNITFQPQPAGGNDLMVQGQTSNTSISNLTGPSQSMSSVTNLSALSQPSAIPTRSQPSSSGLSQSAPDIAGLGSLVSLNVSTSNAINQSASGAIKTISQILGQDSSPSLPSPVPTMSPALTSAPTLTAVIQQLQQNQYQPQQMQSQAEQLSQPQQLQTQSQQLQSLAQQIQSQSQLLQSQHIEQQQLQSQLAQMKSDSQQLPPPPPYPQTVQSSTPGGTISMSQFPNLNDQISNQTVLNLLNNGVREMMSHVPSGDMGEQQVATLSDLSAMQAESTTSLIQPQTSNDESHTQKADNGTAPDTMATAPPPTTKGHYCVLCNAMYAEACSNHGNEEILIPDTPITTRARMSLPRILYLKVATNHNAEASNIPQGSMGIFVNEVLPLKTKFGPLDGIERPATAVEDGEQFLHNMWRVFYDDRAQDMVLMCNNEDKCNWLMFMRRAKCSSEQNVVAYQQATHIYFVTSTDVKIGRELLYWYSKDYAQLLGVPLKPEDMFRCYVCNKPFSDMKKMRSHMQYIHPDTSSRKWRCQLCGRTFTTSAKLNTHMLGHMGMKPHKCLHCNKSFSDQSNLRTHLSIHTGERKFKCTQCEKSFRQKAHLTSHLLTHTGEKRLRCSYCERMFARASDLRQHVYQHTKEQQFKCEYPNCGKVFYIGKNFRKHRKLHTGERDYECEKCSKQFSTRYHMHRHMASCKAFRCDAKATDTAPSRDNREKTSDEPGGDEDEGEEELDMDEEEHSGTESA